MNAEPRAAYGVAFIAAIAIAVLVVLNNREEIETALGRAPVNTAVKPAGACPQ